MSFIRDQTLVLNFRATDATAELLREQVQCAAMALLYPTEKNASDLFRRGAEAVITAARSEETR